LAQERKKTHENSGYNDFSLNLAEPFFSLVPRAQRFQVQDNGEVVRKVMVVNDFSKQRMTNGEPLPEAHDHVGERMLVVMSQVTTIVLQCFEVVTITFGSCLKGRNFLKSRNI